MPITINQSNEGQPKTLPPSGNHVARCYKQIYYGTIPVTDKTTGKEKLMPKIRIEWELPNELLEFKKGEGEKPFSIGKDYTLSLFEMATLRKDLKSWRGKDFTEDELKSFDITKLLGVPCMINVIHSEDGKYANITSITPLPKGMTCPAQVNPNYEFGYEPFDQSKLDKLPEWQQKKIKSSTEYKSIESKYLDIHNEKVHSSDDNNDDLPF